MLSRDVHRLRPATVLVVLAVAAAGAYVVLDGLATEAGERRAVRAVTTAPPPSNDVEWREDGVYIKGRRTLSERDEEQAAAPEPPAQSDRPVPAQDPADHAGLTAAIGQKIVSRMSGPAPGAELLDRVRQGRVGGVILFGDNIRSLDQVRDAVARLQDAAAAGGHPPLLVAIDQEGGTVKRFATLPPAASAAEMGARGTAAMEGEQTGAALAGVGVNVNLAPVADVPATASSFLGTRAFGRDAGAVARSACAFASGLRAGGVLPTLKHFPGLGAAGANTDFAGVSIGAAASTIRAGYAPYRRCGSQGLVMISSAAYPAVTGDGPAVLSRATYASELARVGFRGVTISDDLQAAAVDPIPELAVKASAAGLDLLLYAKTEQASAVAFTQMQRALAAGRLDPGRVRASARRIRALKEQLAG